jgi:hypothetical protein
MGLGNTPKSNNGVLGSMAPKTPHKHTKNSCTTIHTITKCQNYLVICKIYVGKLRNQSILKSIGHNRYSSSFMLAHKRGECCIFFYQNDISSKKERYLFITFKAYLITCLKKLGSLKVLKNL